MVVKKCCLCENITSKLLDELDEIGWSAFRFGNSKAVCFCQNHSTKDIERVMFRELLSRSIMTQEEYDSHFTRGTK